MTFPRLACLALVAVLGFTALSGTAADDKPKKLWVYVGTYTGPKSKGIYLAELDLATGKLTSKGVAGEVANPSFLTIHPNQKYMFAVGEVDNFKGKKGGAASAFSIDPKSGKLTLINQETSGGGGPCHVSIDKEGKHILLANYGGGSVEVIPVSPDGKLGEPTAFIQHKGTGPDKGRQEGPHAHSINLDAANKFAFAADLGLDKVLIYKFDAAKGTLTPNDPAAGEVPPGGGPRHFAFHPNGKYAYVCDEMTSAVTAFAYDAEKGALKTLDTVSTLPERAKIKGNSTAEVLVHPNGKTVYVSNRGHDSIAVFAVEADGAKLTPLQHQATGGKTPRNFNIDPTGSYLVAANQGSGNLVVFKIDPATGKLTATGNTLEVPSPVCVKFMPAPAE
jgi:6-phosphogluconolactonase